MNNINNIFNISNIALENESKNTYNIETDNEFSNINELNILTYSKLRKMKRKIYQDKYENLLDYLLNKNNLKKQHRIKINEDNYFYPNLTNYTKLEVYDFKLNDLKNVLKHYNIKTSGNKENILSRLYNYLHLSYNLIKIQSCIRKYFVKKYLICKGPALNNRNLCVNKKDFCTMCDIQDIPSVQFLSIKDNNHIYGFDIMSIYNIFTQGNNAENPFTKTKFSNNIMEQVLSFIKYSKIINLDVNINFDNLVVNSELDKINLKSITSFHKINLLGNYANSSWFTSLNKENLLLFIKEIIDIWNYRANLEEKTKCDICPPHGNPFKNIINSNINILEYIKVKKIALTIIDTMISNGIDEEHRKLGAFYILSALTLVNIDAANALPWLYQSVMYT